MLQSSGSIYLTFCLYFVAMFFIGIYFYKKTKSLSDYVLGDRTLGPWVTALSASASDMSGWLLMGLPGAVFLGGLSSSFWIALGLILGTYANWYFVAKRLREYTKCAGDSLTISMFFENRFQDKSKTLRFLSGTFIIIFFIFYTASGFVAGAKLFSTVFDISYIYSLVIAVCIIISYTFLGGFLAVSWTDFFQGLLMLFAIVFVSIFGFSLLTSNVDMLSTHLNLLQDIKGTKIGLLTIVSSMAWGLGYFGQPHILTRFMAIKSPKDIKVARIIACSWTLICLISALLVGLIGFAYAKTGVLGIGFDAEKIFMTLIDAFFHPLVAGVMLAAILAAVMSTADSQLIVVSSSFTEDFYKFFMKRQIKEKELILVSRLALILVALIAAFFAKNPNSSVLGLVSYAWGGFGAAFGPLVIFSLFWRRMTKNGAIAGMVTGALTVIIWKNFLSGGIFDIYELLPGFVLAGFAIVIVSLLDKSPGDEIVEIFDKVVSKNKLVD